MTERKKTILITGARAGFGRDAAIALTSRGHRVIATTKTEIQATELINFFDANKLAIEVFKLDITNENDRNKILNYEIDVLINNAGTGESGGLAEIPMDKVRDNFEVNVFGTLALTQLALRDMMARDKGLVLIISSLAGRVAMPFLGVYSMTKFSLSAAADALRQELSQVTKKVHISVIEPGAYHTGFNQRNIAKKFKWMDKNSYFYGIKDQLKINEEKYFNLFEVKSTTSLVKQIIRACEARDPAGRYSAPWWQDWGLRILRIFK